MRPGGNAYNQRAVLAAHEHRDLQAVYFYTRSLAVPQPFSIARENLVQLFEKVRQEHAKLAPGGANSRAAKNPSAGWKLPELSKIVQTRFLHLQGAGLPALIIKNERLRFSMRRLENRCRRLIFSLLHTTGCIRAGNKPKTPCRMLSREGRKLC